MNGGFRLAEQIRKDKRQVIDYLDNVLVDGKYNVYNRLKVGNRITITLWRK